MWRRQGEAERELQEQVDKNQVLLDRIQAMSEEAEAAAGMHVESYADLKEMFKKLVVERNETNQRQGQAMLEAQVVALSEARTNVSINIVLVPVVMAAKV